MNAFIIEFGVFVAPVVLWVVFSFRRMSWMAAQAERDALPFNPKGEPIPSRFLGRFPLPERTYLRQQLNLARIGYCLSSWFFTMFLTISLLPLPSWKVITWTDPSAYNWFLYVHSAVTSFQFSLSFCGVATIAAILPMRQRPAAQFYRTRPLSISFLFWARVLPLLAVAVASVITGAALSFALLAATKGPVWQHLPSAFPGIVSSDDDGTRLYLALLATSLPRVFLSLGTTIVLLFSAFAALLTIPLNLLSGQNPTPLRMVLVFGGVLGAGSISAIDALGILRLPRELFFYTHLGPPPPYAFAVFPILLTAGFLLTARFFTSRLEL